MFNYEETFSGSLNTHTSKYKTDVAKAQEKFMSLMYELMVSSQFSMSIIEKIFKPGTVENKKEINAKIESIKQATAPSTQKNFELALNTTIQLLSILPKVNDQKAKQIIDNIHNKITLYLSVCNTTRNSHIENVTTTINKLSDHEKLLLARLKELETELSKTKQHAQTYMQDLNIATHKLENREFTSTGIATAVTREIGLAKKIEKLQELLLDDSFDEHRISFLNMTYTDLKACIAAMRSHVKPLTPEQLSTFLEDRSRRMSYLTYSSPTGPALITTQNHPVIAATKRIREEDTQLIEAPQEVEDQDVSKKAKISDIAP